MTSERNKRRSDNRAADLHNRYQNTRWAIIHAFDKARLEHWTHGQLLTYRGEWIYNAAYQKLPGWVKYQLTGVWDTCHDLLWRELKVCYPHPTTRVLTIYDDLKDKPWVDLSRLDTSKCFMCYLHDGRLHQFN